MMLSGITPRTSNYNYDRLFLGFLLMMSGFAGL